MVLSSFFSVPARRKTLRRKNHHNQSSMGAAVVSKKKLATKQAAKRGQDDLGTLFLFPRESTADSDTCCSICYATVASEAPTMKVSPPVAKFSDEVVEEAFIDEAEVIEALHFPEPPQTPPLLGGVAEALDRSGSHSAASSPVSTPDNDGKKKSSSRRKLIEGVGGADDVLEPKKKVGSLYIESFI